MFDRGNRPRGVQILDPLYAMSHFTNMNQCQSSFPIMRVLGVVVIIETSE